MVQPIHIDPDHEVVLRRVSALMGSKPGTPEFDELDVLATLIAAYERERYPMRKLTPLEAIRFRMEQKPYTVEEFGRIVGSIEEAAEILSGQRALDLHTMRRLQAEWDIPGDILLADEAA